MVLIRRPWILLGLLLVIVTSCTLHGQDATPPERKTFTLPAQLEGPGKLLEDAGITIIYGANSVPPPVGISEAAKKRG